MPTAPVGFVDATFVFSCDGVSKDITWGLGFDFDNFSTLDPTQMAENIYGAFTAAGGPYRATLIDTAWTFRGVVASKQLEEGPLVGQFLLPVVGTSTNAPPPVNCSLLMSKNSTLGGRRNRGRAYLPCYGISEGDITAAGTVSSTITNYLAGLHQVALDSLIADDTKPVIFHQSAPFTPTPVTSVSISTLLGTQRRRMR